MIQFLTQRRIEPHLQISAHWDSSLSSQRIAQAISFWIAARIEQLDASACWPSWLHKTVLARAKRRAKEKWDPNCSSTTCWKDRKRKHPPRLGAWKLFAWMKTWIRANCNWSCEERCNTKQKNEDMKKTMRDLEQRRESGRSSQNRRKQNQTTEEENKTIREWTKQGNRVKQRRNERASWLDSYRKTDEKPNRAEFATWQKKNQLLVWASFP